VLAIKVIYYQPSFLVGRRFGKGKGQEILESWPGNGRVLSITLGDQFVEIPSFADRPPSGQKEFMRNRLSCLLFH
jgi:hypothetical protein